MDSLRVITAGGRTCGASDTATDSLTVI